MAFERKGWCLMRVSSGMRLGVLLALLWPVATQAQARGVVPNAGQAIRDIEATQPALPAPTDEVELELPKADRPSAAATPDTLDLRLLVKAFVIEGNQVFSAQALLQLLEDLPGRELDLSGLRGATERITAHYQKHGHLLARAFLPAQEIDAGVVRIEVIEGRYGRIEVHNQSRTLDSVIRAPLSSLDRGTAVQSGDLERSLLLLNDLPGVKVKGTLRAGREPGTTDLLVDAQPGPWASGSLEADNFGGYHTGEFRLGGSFNLNNPLRLGDQLNLRVLGTDRDQRYYRTAYQLPLGPWSTRLGAAYSHMSYALNRKRLKKLEMNGQASVQSVFVVQPILRGRTFDLSAQLQYENKQLRDDIDLIELSRRKHIELWTLSLGGNRQDRFLGGGYNQFNLSYGSGQLTFDDAFEQRSDRDTAATGGGFAKTNLQLARLQRLGNRFQLYAQLNAQWASSNLDSSEKMGLGGPYGVRAYPQSAGIGDQGWQAGLELSYALAPRWQLSLFSDKGYVQVNRLPWTKEINTQRLQSAGLGARWSGAQRQLNLSSAWPLDNRKAGDGPEHTPRIWVSATQFF
ncbi:ShlB/FhaC/HecB family hemolysin secretion/activation protein [Pseudomonas protegens]|uniref:ShlB/FhaC/HecB family hemolysin secretion/activation protein n=1 Tax=Pseudomonas protegens TaxID=380021 RepID=UPI003D36B6CA